MEATEESYRAFRSGVDHFFTEEGRLRGHTFWNGSYIDMVILAVYRETWASLVPSLFASLLTRQAPPGGDGRAR
jgi:hypothetical protein